MVKLSSVTFLQMTNPRKGKGFVKAMLDMEC